MSDYDPRYFDYAPLDAAFETLDQGVQRNFQAIEDNEQYLQQERSAANATVDNLITEMTEAASVLDPNDPEDAAVLDQMNQEIESARARVAQAPAWDARSAAQGARTGSGVTTARQAATQAEYAREDEVAARDTQNQIKLINVEGGIEAGLQEAGFNHTMDRLEAEQAWESAENDLQRTWQSGENMTDRELERFLQERGFEIQEESNAIQRLRTKLDADFRQQEIDLENLKVSNADNERALTRLGALADAIPTIGEEGRDEQIARFTQVLDANEEAGIITPAQRDMLVYTSGLHDTAAAREARAAADTAEAQADVNTIDAWTREAEAGASMVDRTEAAARQGQVATVESELRRAESILAAPEGRHPQAARERAQELLDRGDELVSRAQEHQSNYDENVRELLDQLKLTNEGQELQNAESTRVARSHLSAMYEDPDTAIQDLEDRLSPSDWRLLGGEDYAKTMIRLEVGANDRARTYTQQQQVAAGLRDNVWVDDPEGWKQAFIDAHQQSGVWGNVPDEQLEMIADMHLRAAKNSEDARLKDLARIDAEIAESGARAQAAREQAGMYNRSNRPDPNAQRDFSQAIDAANQVLQVLEVRVNSVCSIEYPTDEQENACVAAQEELALNTAHTARIAEYAAAEAGLGPEVLGDLLSRDEVIELARQHAEAGGTPEEFATMYPQTAGTYEATLQREVWSGGGATGSESEAAPGDLSAAGPTREAAARARGASTTTRNNDVPQGEARDGTLQGGDPIEQIQNQLAGPAESPVGQGGRAFADWATGIGQWVGNAAQGGANAVESGAARALGVDDPNDPANRPTPQPAEPRGSQVRPETGDIVGSPRDRMVQAGATPQEVQDDLAMIRTAEEDPMNGRNRTYIHRIAEKYGIPIQESPTRTASAILQTMGQVSPEVPPARRGTRRFE